MRPRRAPRDESADASDHGFTLIETLIVVALMGLITTAMASVMLLGLKVLIGLEAGNPSQPGLQNGKAVNAQLDANTTFPRLIRDFSGDVSGSRPADVSLLNTMPCNSALSDPALPVTSVLLSTISTKLSGASTRVVYQYSADVPRFLGQITRYTCAMSGTGTAAEVVATGLNSTRFATAVNDAGTYRLTFYSVTGRKYAVDAAPRGPGQPGPVAAQGQAMTSLGARDANADGSIDTLVAQFGSATVQPQCHAPAAWSVRPVGGAAVTAAAWSGSQAILTLTGAGAGDTTVNALSVSFLPPTGCTSIRPAIDTTPVDEAPPVLMSLRRGALTTDDNGTVEAGDSLYFVFSEPLRPLSLPAGGSADVVLSTPSLGATPTVVILDGNTGGTRDVVRTPVDTGGDYFSTRTGAEQVRWRASAALSPTAPNELVIVLRSGGCLGTCLLLQPSSVGDLRAVTPSPSLQGTESGALSARANALFPVPAGAPAPPFRLF